MIAHLTYWKKLAFHKEPLWESIVVFFFDQLQQFVKKDKKNSRERHPDLVIDALDVGCTVVTIQQREVFQNIIQTVITNLKQLTLSV